MNSIFRWSMLLLALCLVSFTLSAACSDDDDDDNDDAADDEGDDDSDCGSADFLPGTWTAEMITIEIASDLTYHAIGATQTGYNVTGTIQLDGCTASLTDLAGENPCPASQIGVYNFVVTDTTLSTTLVEDACAGRAIGLDGTVFTR